METNTTLLFVAAVIALAGQWSRKRTVNPAMVIGFFFVALTITIINQANAKLAFYLSALITASLTLTYLPELLSRVGLLSPSTISQQKPLKQVNKK